ncbi:MAG TPA: DEAD/DEAH box helicase, partial [Thermoanaerobaculia bacterium]|nr:DEAD/DEAH box helicase [Thermoanaerobaculia bacterium]
MSGAVEQVRHLVAAYRRFIKSSYRLADPRLRAQFEDQVDGAEVLVKGPYVTLARDFLAERTLDALIEEGVADPRLLKLRWAFNNQCLFKHQENALRAVSAGRNTVVKTGTASGKTEAFLVPVLSGILRAKADGVRGTQAIFLYPMNALANDQLERLRALIRDSGVPLTFALYTGESATVASTIGEPLAGHELTQREAIRDNPPDIILTNYKQLEFLLIRQADRTLFSRALRFLVLDEIHSYRGALATEIACLIRRLKARCGLEAGELRCIGTSATVSQDHGGDQALAAFASGLFDEPFHVDDVIGEIYREEPRRGESYVPPFVAPSDDELLTAANSDVSNALAVAERLCGRKAAAGRLDAARLVSLLSGNVVVDALRDFAREPRTYEELANALLDRPPAGVDIPLESRDLARLIEAYVAIGSIGDETTLPLLRPKLHTFFHGVYDVGLCFNPECRTLVRDGSELCPECRAVVRPAVLCRTCGQDFVKVRVDPDDPSQTLPNDDFFSDDDTRFITSRLIGASDDDEDENGGSDEAVTDDAAVSAPANATSGRRARTRVAPGARPRGKLLPVWVDHASGRLFLERPADAAGSVREQWMLPGRGNSCPV